MAYRVLARAYRSATFDEVVGQGPIATTLKNAITSGRVHHGYLFTGTRGVGKTSMARILAKALNCLSFDAPTAKPCTTCDSCKAIAEGEDVDVVEIDAASNTGVDNIRELRGNASLRPARSRFKVYIIDEVHMLSTGAFNALLKTLEEPPPHVKFILATTETHKVPATIQSRCQRFDFRAIDAASIAKHLEHILKAEGITAEEVALKRVGRLANGSMRDALSLLDQLLSYDAQRLTAATVNEVLPPPHDELAGAVMDRVAENDAAGALRALDEGLQSGRTVERFCEHLVEHVRTLMLLSTCGEDTELVDVPGVVRSTLFEQAEKFDAPTYVYLIALLEELRRNVKFNGAARALADAAVVRMAMCKQFSDLGELLKRIDSQDQGSSSRGIAKAKSNTTMPSIKPALSEQTPPQSNPSGSNTTTRPSGAPGASGTPRSSETPGTSGARSAGTSKTTAVNSSPWRAASSPSITGEQRERALRDPLVQRVREEVDGKLLGVRVIPADQKAESTEETGDLFSGAEED